MLDFTFTPAQEDYRAQLRELALKELLPRYHEGDREQRYPAEQIRRILRFGAEFWKGREDERDLIAVGITAEEVARGDFNCVLPSLGPAYQTDVFYVFARTDPWSTGWRGISAFLVPRETPGLRLEPVEDLGCRAIPRGVARFENVEIPADAMVGAPDDAFVRISRFFDVNRAVIGLKCVGAALQTLDETVDHARTRVAFGAPLAAHQGVSFPLAEAATWLELARWHCYRVLWMRQHDIACQKEGAMAKWWAPKVAADVIHRCLLFHGHRGYSQELPIEQRLRDVIGWQIGDGTDEVMKLIITRSLFGRDAADKKPDAARAG